jgi:hypothetical protein
MPDFAAIADGMGDSLEKLVAKRLFEQMQAEKIAEMRANQQAEQQRIGLQGQGLQLQSRGLDQRDKGIAEDVRQFDVTRDDRLAAGEQERADAAKSTADMEAFEQSMPAHLRGVFHASGHKSNFKPEDFVNAPETYEQQDTRGILKLKQTERIKTDEEIRQAKATAGLNRGDGRLVQVMGPQGTPIWVREQDAVGQPAAQAARAVTGQERQALSFYNRAKQATDDISGLEESIAKAGLGSQLQLQHAPNMMQTQQQQSYRQAQRAFTEARLRKESGAAIPQGEYENDARTYFAQPGDTPQTIEQKRRARTVVLEGLKFGSGKAYNEFYGDDASGVNVPVRDPDGARGAQNDAAARAAELIKKYGGG